MRLVLLGGTAWLGRTIAAVAVGHGHEVTCLARGDSGHVPTKARFVRADRDRDDAYDGVAGERWDAVIDVARQPGHVRRAVATLESVVGRYLFVSSVNVYASQRELDQDEDAPLLPPLASDVMASMEQYGEAKVACEQAVTAAFGAARTLIARAGLIGGPGDWSGRSGYWPWRFARSSNSGRAVLVPDAPDLPTAVIDVRDVASRRSHISNAPRGSPTRRSSTTRTKKGPSLGTKPRPNGSSAGSKSSTSSRSHRPKALRCRRYRGRSSWPAQLPTG